MPLASWRYRQLLSASSYLLRQSMSIQHIVWLKKKESCTDLHMQSLLAEVAKLTDLIPNIENISCGRNLTDRANGFTHGIIVTLTCQDALACYINHPAHVSVGKKLNENANILAMDYET
jgi:hypothetical protein